MVRLAVCLALGALLFALPARAGMSIVPLPEILTDPNEGNTYGFLPVILLVDQKGRLEHIIADDVRYNKITGWFPAFRLYGYPTLEQRYFVTVRKSQKIDEDYVGEYEHDGILDGAMHALANLTYFRDSRMRFYGFGNETADSGESNYTQRKFSALLRLGAWPIENVEVAWQERLEVVTIRTGGVTDLPFTGDLYPNVNGLQGSTVYGNMFTVAYDTRDSQAIPRRGFLGAAHVEFVDRALGSSTSFTKWGFEIRNFTPFRERFVLALHSVLDYLDDAVGTPFYEQNSIGGVNSLRGFGEDRFVDQNRFFSSAELRTRVYQKRVFDVSAELEVAPFVDAGEVFAKGGGMPFSALHVVGGVGFRGVVPPQVVGFVDLGYGSDGPAVFTGLDYPF